VAPCTIALDRASLRATRRLTSPKHAEAALRPHTSLIVYRRNSCGCGRPTWLLLVAALLSAGLVYEPSAVAAMTRGAPWQGERRRRLRHCHVTCEQAPPTPPRLAI